MKATRWPALILIPALLVAMLAAGRSDGEDDNDATSPDTTDFAAEPGRAPDPLPIAVPPDAASDTWYCPAATATGEFGARDAVEADGTDTPARPAVLDRSVLILTNTAEDPRPAVVRLFGAEGPVGSDEIEIAGRSRTQIDLADLVEGAEGAEGAEVAALVEIDGGGVSVVQTAFGPVGPTVSPCLTTPAGTWYLPSAATTLDARALLTLFNPFPDDAILEIAFVDRDQVRVPTGFEAFPVPAKSVVVVDLTDLVTVRTQFATSVRARAGQVVAAMVQSYDGSEGPEGMAIVPGAPTPSETWIFPAGRWDDDERETYVIYNPGERDAQVDLTVALDDPSTNGSVSAFELTVPRGGFTVIGSSSEEWPRVPAGVGHSATVRVRNGEPVVALQRLTNVSDGSPGMAMALGSPLLATRWIVAAVDLDEAVGSTTVLNGSPLSLAQVDVEAIAAGASTALPPVEIEEGLRVVVRPADEVEVVTAGAVVEASSPVVVSSAYAFEDGGRAWLVATPVQGTDARPSTVAAEGASGGTSTTP